MTRYFSEENVHKKPEGIIMKTTPVLTKVRSSSPSIHSQKEAVDLDYKVSRTVIAILALLSAFIGIWGLVCITAGFLMTGDLIDLGASWFSAIIGL